MGNSIVRVNGKAYEKIRKVSEGGYGEIYEIHRGNEIFALKWIRGIRTGEHLQQILLEIQIQRRLQHPNLLPLIEAEVRNYTQPASSTHSHHFKQLNENGYENYVDEESEEQENTCNPDNETLKEVLMIFPLYKGGSLQTFLEARAHSTTGLIDESICWQIFHGILMGVKELHDIGFAHCDLKPGNILLTGNNHSLQPVIIDFGSISPIFLDIKTHHDAMILTERAEQLCSAGYRAPELWNASYRGKLDFRKCDIWSLGCILYSISFGPYSPFESMRDGVQPLSIINGYFTFPSSSSSYSKPFLSMIQWILNPMASARPSLNEVLERLKQVRAIRLDRSCSLTTLMRTGESYYNDDSNSDSESQESYNPVDRNTDWADFKNFPSQGSAINGLREKSSRKLSVSQIHQAPHSAASYSVKSMSRSRTSSLHLDDEQLKVVSYVRSKSIDETTSTENIWKDAIPSTSSRYIKRGTSETFSSSRQRQLSITGRKTLAQYLS